ncbi:MAG TPA: hypothetical protein VJJ81_00175 [Candidatus Babeliales bacterium]|nr:hypothetical protein [Candidatus Babeliales bacterium]
MTQTKFKLSNFKFLGLALGLLSSLFSANVSAVAVPALDATRFPAGLTVMAGASTADIAGGAGYDMLDGFALIVDTLPLRGGKTAADITTANFNTNYDDILNLAKTATWAVHLMAQNPAFIAAAAPVIGARVPSAEATALNGAKDIFENGLHISWAALAPAPGSYAHSASATYNIPWFSDIGGGVKGYNVPDATGHYALDRARTNGDVDLIAILEAQGDAQFTAAPPPPPVHTAETLVNAAKTGNQADVMAAITTGGVNINAKNAEGDTALIAATLALDADMVDLLLAQTGIDKELAGKAGRNAASLLRNKGTNEAASLGFQAAANIKTKADEAAYQAKRKAVFAKLKA